MIYTKQADGACHLGDTGSCSAGENTGGALEKADVMWGCKGVTLYSQETGAGNTTPVQPRGRRLTQGALQTALHARAGVA